MFNSSQKANFKLFTLIILSAVIPTLIVGILTLRISEQSLQKDAEVKLTVANSTAKKQLIDWVEENKQEITYLSGISGTTQDINALVNEQNAKDNTQAIALVNQDLKKFIDNHKSFFEVFLLNPNTGEVLVSTTPGQGGKLHADQPYFIEGKIHPFVQNVYYSLSVQQQTITLSAPVRNANGVLLGVLAGHMNLDQLNSVLQQPSGLGETVKSYAINTYKLIVAGLPNLNHVQRSSSYYQINTLPVIEGLQGKSGVATYTTFNGAQVVGSYLPIPELNLLVITEIDEQEILKPIQSLLFITYTTTGITLGVTLLVATYLMRLFLTSINSYRKRLEIDKEHVERLLFSLSEGVLAIDELQMVWLCNAAAERILGMNKNQVIGKNIDEVFKINKDHTLIKFAQYNQVKSTADNWYEINSNTANQKVLFLMTAPILVGASGQSGWVVTFSDMTKEAQLESMKLDFVSMAAHELRTPLTTIRGYSALLTDEIGQTGSPVIKDYINKLIIGSNKLGELIDNLLNVSRIERDTFKIETVPIDLTKVIETAVAALTQQAKLKQQILQFNQPKEKMPFVTADAFRINQGVTNLVANAINYTQEGSTITIEIQKLDTFLQVSVSDNGPGIPSEALPKLFTKFFRVSSVLSQGSKGTGLGLYITKSIIETHHGKIWVESTLNKGTTFFFTLPIATDTDIEKYNKAVKTHSLVNQQHKGFILNKERFAMRNK